VNELRIVEPVPLTLNAMYRLIAFDVVDEKLVEGLMDKVDFVPLKLDQGTKYPNEVFSDILRDTFIQRIFLLDIQRTFLLGYVLGFNRQCNRKFDGRQRAKCVANPLKRISCPGSVFRVNLQKQFFIYHLKLYVRKHLFKLFLEGECTDTRLWRVKKPEREFQKQRGYPTKCKKVVPV
jgi:hypothetical protein